MSDIAIQIESLSKQYYLGQSQISYRTIRESITNALATSIRWLEQPKPETIWALKDICFEIKHGEVVGVIGRNGAGKSTLLKILSRIIKPTAGRAKIYGRVGSLLEVGTGFHPELTGRENIYLNGAILGMKKVEINRKFDEIVAFAEIERYLDTPVKRYSSGMYMRLAFAVAVHLETEILLVDEVLAVGDAAFQKKCLAKMEEVSSGGRTILFVSHQMNSIRKLCRDCIWLDAGVVRTNGPTATVISAYESSFNVPTSIDLEKNGFRSHQARFLRWQIIEPATEESNKLTTLGPVNLQVVVQVNRFIRNGSHGISLWNSENQLMWGWSIGDLEIEPGIHTFSYNLPTLPLRPGSYYWWVNLYDGEKLLDNWYCLPEMIIATPPLAHHRDEWSGVLNLPCNFFISTGAKV